MIEKIKKIVIESIKEIAPHASYIVIYKQKIKEHRKAIRSIRNKVERKLKKMIKKNGRYMKK